MNRSFYALLVSQTSTNLSFALYIMAVVMYLYNQTGSTTLATTVTLINIASRMVSGIVLPTISDRFPLPILLKISQIIQLVFLSVLIFFLYQPFSMLMLLIMMIAMAIIAFFNGFFSPIKSSLIKVIVPETDRVRANSLISSVDQTFLFTGWTFGGLLLSWVGKEITLGIALSLIIISIVSLVFVKGNRDTKIQSQDNLVTQISAGWKFLFQHKGLRVMMAMDMIEEFVGTIWIGAVTLTFVNEALGKGEEWWGYINGAYYFGTIIGGIFVYRLSQRMRGRLVLYMVMGSFIFGILTFIYGFVSNAFLALALVLLMGPSYQLRDLSQETLFQNSANENILPKIMAAKAALIHFIFIVSTIIIGVMTDIFGARFVYIFSGCLLMFSALFGFFRLFLQKKGHSLESEAI